MNTIQIESKYSSGVYGKRDITIVRGEGARVWDENGRIYIDCVGGIGVANVGHCHPAVVSAIVRQAQTLITCQEMFYNDQRAALMQQLARIMPGDLERLFLCNSGTEAVEGAIKFARLSTGRPGVVAAMRGFHGRTLGALSATHKEKYRAPFGPLVPGFSHVPFGSLEKLEAAIDDDQTAAVLLEVVQGEGGIRPGDAEYFQGVKSLCVERGAMLIFDEVQSGFGRTGRWFACEHVDVTPDLLAMGKGIAGGVPMGAIGIGPRVTGLTPGVHGSTFGGNPLACAAALAVLQVIEDEDLLARAEENGRYFRQRLTEINSPLIRDVRGQGLMVGVELRVRAQEVVMGLMARGVMALTAGTTVLRLLPTLVISREELDMVVAAIAEAVRALAL